MPPTPLEMDRRIDEHFAIDLAAIQQLPQG